MKTNIIFRSHAGPPLLVPAVAYTLLFAASLIVSSLMRHGAPIADLNASARALHDFYTANPEAVRISAFFFFASAIPLGIYTATVVSRLRFLGVRAAGTYIALFGGFAAAGALAVCALCSWVLAVPEVNASASVTRAFFLLGSTVGGGVVFSTGFGLLAAGVSVTSFFARLLPRWLVWFGMSIAVVGVLSTFSLIASPMVYTFPITRFAGIVWFIVVGAMLPRTIRKHEIEKVTDGSSHATQSH